MSKDNRLIDYVNNGGTKPMVSLQIGCGAGFDCKLAGKEWLSEGTLDDTIRAYEIVGGEPFYNIGLPGFGQVVPELVWQSRLDWQGEKKVITNTLETPYKTLTFELHEKKFSGMTPVKSPLVCGDNLDIVAWYADQFHKAVPHVRELLEPHVQHVKKHGPVSVQWNVQPFELFGLPAVVDAVMLAMTERQRYREVCDRIRDVNVEICREVFKTGADFVFLGGPGAEMMSPELYEEFIVPDSEVISQAVHDAGGLIYSHICSPIEPFLSKGYYNKMGIDLFETLSPPPVGNVADLAKAREILDDQMCTRGNLGLDVLLQGTPEDVEAGTIAILDATKGSKHIVAASDYLFYDIPIENVQTMVRTVNVYKSD